MESKLVNAKTVVFWHFLALHLALSEKRGPLA
jgi:hypothetical protein